MITILPVCIFRRTFTFHKLLLFDGWQDQNSLGNIYNGVGTQAIFLASLLAGNKGILNLGLSFSVQLQIFSSISTSPSSGKSTEWLRMWALRWFGVPWILLGSETEAVHWFFFFLFRVAPGAYGSSQARSWIEGAAAACATAIATQDPSCICNPCCSLQQRWILNPLNKARDWTCILMDASRVLNPLNNDGNFHNSVFNLDFTQSCEVGG